MARVAVISALKTSHCFTIALPGRHNGQYSAIPHQVGLSWLLSAAHAALNTAASTPASARHLFMQAFRNQVKSVRAHHRSHTRLTLPFRCPLCGLSQNVELTSRREISDRRS